MKGRAGFCVLEARAGVARGKAFSATLEEVNRVTSLSFPTVTAARKTLLKLCLIAQAGDGCYRVSVRSACKNFAGKKIASPPEGPLQESGTSSESSVPAKFLQALYPERIQTVKYSGTAPVSRIEELTKKKGGLQGGVAGPARILQVSPEEKRVAVQKACRTLGVRDTGKFAQLAMAKLTLLLKDDVNLAEAQEVAEWARAKWDGGDRFVQLLNLLHIWSRSRFTAYLGAARSSPKAEGYRVMPASGDRDAWDKGLRDKLRERGLA